MTPLQIGAGLDAVGTFEGKVGVTVLLLALLAVLGWLAGRTRARIEFESENVERLANVGIVLSLAALAISIGAALLSLWELSVFDALGIEQPVVAFARGALTLGLLLGVYVLSGVVKRVVFEFAEDRSAITRHQTELVFRVSQVTLYVLVVVVAFGIWDVNLGGLLVGAGFLGIVVGMAARQTLGSLIAGFVLMFARPFEIGDWVEIGNREGIVTEISIVNTRIQTFDGEYAMIPNDVVSSNEIVNRTRKGRLRLSVEVGVDYETDVDRAIDVAMEAMGEVDDILTVPQPQVVLKGFGDSAVLLGLRFWIDKPSARRKWRAQTAVIAAVKAAFDREGIKIPFPQRELMGRLEEGGFRLSGHAADELPVSPDGGPDDA